MKDLLIIPDKSGKVEFDVYGSQEDSGLLLLQRLYVLMFTQGSGLRPAGGFDLLSFAEGANQPPDDVLNSMLALCCSTALSRLDEEDRSNVRSFTGTSKDGIITCTLELADGTTVEGRLPNA